MSSRTAQLIRYFVEHVPNAGRTRVVKFLYMADHEARRYLGRPLTELDYRWDQFGPYDPAILQELDRLAEAGFLEFDAIRDGQGYARYRYRPTHRSFPRFLKKEEQAILDYIIDQYANMKLVDLLEEVVYQTRPMRAARERGERLRMEVVDNELRAPGMDLGEVIESMEELKSGGGRSFEDIRAETAG